MADRDERNKERDDYWDIEKLVPKRRGGLRPFATEATVATHIIPEGKATITDTPDRPASERTLTHTDGEYTKGVEEESYIPENAGLIKKVTITKTIDKYDFYDSFRRSALLYYDCIGSPSEYAEFYSFMPQYAHMSKAQQSYYLYWRSELRRGRYVKTDYSYIHLYVYEILNLPDKIPASEGVKLLARVWKQYRDKLPRLDATMSVWLQDYCLVHKLPCPTDEIKDFIPFAIKGGALKEFYLSDIVGMSEESTELLIASLSDYDWRMGKFVDGGRESKLGIITSDKDYKREMLGAMRLVIGDLWKNRILGDTARHTTIKRDAFPHSLCTHQVKSKLTIEYISFSASEDVRRDVTASVRYVENKLRHLLGVKSRLSVKELPPRYAAIIDGYFESLFRVEKRRRIEESRPAYEKLYEAERTALSFEGADEIERMSWQNTERLVIEDEDSIEYASHGIGSMPELNDVVSNTASEASGTSDALVSDGEPCGDNYGLNEDEIKYIGYLIYGKPDTYICKKGATLDMLVERINSAFIDNYGDIIIEMTDNGYALIDDYYEEIKEWLESIKM